MNLKRLHPDHQEGPESLRGLFQLTAIVSAAMILLFSGFSFYRVFSGFVIASARDDSVNVCHLLIDQQRRFLIKDVPGQGARLAVDPDTIASLDRVMREFLHPFGIIKIKVYDNTSRILYSTDATIIGRIDTDNRRLSNALAGNVDAKMQTKDEVRDLVNEQLLDVDVVETYVPVRDQAGKVLGSSEIYLNVSKYRNLIRIGVTIMIAVMVLVLTAVFGISYILVRRGTVKLRQVQSKLETMATTDLLTGIANRGQIMIRGEQEFARAFRQPPTELCCIMLDIDHFKRINDNWGHGGMRCCGRRRYVCGSASGLTTLSGATAVRNSWCCCRIPLSITVWQWLSVSGPAFTVKPSRSAAMRSGSVSVWVFPAPTKTIGIWAT